MSISKRILDLAKANLNALLDKAGVSDDTPLGQLTDAELEAELERRKARRLRESEEARVREAAERAARQRAAERAAENAKKRMADVEAEFQRMKERAGTNGSAQKPRSAQDERKKKEPPPPRPSVGMSEKRLRELYQQLETPYGAPFEDVKKSFRRLMRKYHPDLHVGNPAKQKTATQLTMTLTTAYNELELHLVGRSR
jgi:hypothetical protein